MKREAELAKREGVLEERERQITQKQILLDEKLESLEKVRKDLVSKLEKVSSISKDEAQKILLENVDKDLSSEISKKIKEAEEEIKLAADEKAKEILASAMQHGVTDYISEFTTSKVKLPDEEMKGRIIGKEGRNVRTFEQVTGVDVVMDDEIPDTLILSSFDPVRREIAKVSLERLMEDGRIQPQRIEEIVQKTKEDINKIMRAAGEKLCHDVGVYNLPVELVDIIGRFKYRYSYGQNLIMHTQEETQIGIVLAKEIGADVNVVRLGCLLHDIGKVVTEGDEGTHVEKGVQLAKKFGISEKVINCIAEHHEDKPFSAVESILVYIADAISGGRPGARHENVGDYIKRMDDIEKIATSFEGVEKAFAVQAGREVRVIVIPEKVPDDELPKLTHEIADRISKEVMVPGAVKITAIRETRYSESTLTT
ncbi:ribonuclease Y [Candidatus Daviesbacteria bacterium RIFCSPHIGHO2_01_FULL_40_24]|nr:MAG: ribonuclease Y [Candidatus Daviesbacteria bacterium RIFCSPHIGHO2_01_FULL_40_24]OGE28297.1 MAG: ribonuclease Y [Candidatus Daviesbacteria bacterium RIFCSPHIGHO2_02_FULL_40_16]OGE41918.1 MAG: ribonuclease Y [Candidatus Daviesbacteria bacterium RIFCSPLOWO2_01_FULL_39_23]OGE66716.1 MAG: ribonuclease Y [Candidatus Daviesbacteria bacterium RIFCSPLOWO2_02_FULL_39_13]